MDRYFLGRDNDSHRFVVPVARANDWDNWLEIPDDDERSWTAPEFAQAVGVSPRLVTFTNPEIH